MLKINSEIALPKEPLYSTEGHVTLCQRSWPGNEVTEARIKTNSSISKSTAAQDDDLWHGVIGHNLSKQYEMYPSHISDWVHFKFLNLFLLPTHSASKTDLCWILFNTHRESFNIYNRSHYPFSDLSFVKYPSQQMTNQKWIITCFGLIALNVGMWVKTQWNGETKKNTNYWRKQ